MTLKQFIDELTEIMHEESEGLEVVATDQESRETYTPIISVSVDNDGVRRLRAS